MIKNKGDGDRNKYFSRNVFLKFIVLMILGLLVIFFLNERYTTYSFFFYLGSLIFMIFGFYFWDKDFFDFLIYALVTIPSFIALEISFNLGFYLNFLISLFLGLFFAWRYLNKKTNEDYALLLLLAFAVLWIILGINVKYRFDWVLENLLNVPFVIILIVVSKWFRFSKTSYSLFYLYMFMNVIGSHYTYAEVPFGYWLSDFFELSRNHYDRIIHFCFGLLLAYPMKEVYVRVGNYRGIWAILAPITMVFGLSAFYEILEWWIAVIFGGDLGIAYLGTQGDIWDAQKDMGLAGLGSIITMAITFVLILITRGRAYLSEIVQSFNVKEKTDVVDSQTTPLKKKK